MNDSSLTEREAAERWKRDGARRTESSQERSNQERERENGKGNWISNESGIDWTWPERNGRERERAEFVHSGTGDWQYVVTIRKTTVSRIVWKG